MYKTAIIISIGLLLTACSSSHKTVQTLPAKDGEKVMNKGQAIATDNHLEQGKALYFKGKYKQAAQHLVKVITTDFENWEAHHFLGLCQQRQKRYDRSIGSFNNALKFCPAEKQTLAKISYHLGLSWEREGYLYKAAEKYEYALKLDPRLAAARAGSDRVKAKTEKAEKSAKAKKEEAQ